MEHQNRNNFFRRRGKRSQNRNNSPSGSQKKPARFPKHPPHLRGKEIGLYYARKKRQMNNEESLGNEVTGKKNNSRNVEELRQPIGRVVLSEARQNFIENSLKNTDLIGQMFITDNGSYDHVSDSSFKRNFLNTIHGNIDDNLKELPMSPIKRLPEVDNTLYDELVSKHEKETYRNMMYMRQKLPSYKKKDEILKIIEENPVVVISGETGCGKTTQVSQFILDEYILQKKGSLCRVVCTQPRRISAVSVAERVAEERTERLGNSIGYHIRLEKVLPREQGSAIFCTTGVVLKWMETDPCLSNVSHLIIDEIHERDVMSDFIVALLKKILSRRKDLKLILMSATLNADKFSNYFDDCPHINIPGFTYAVEEFFLEDVLQITGFVYQNTNKDKKMKKRKKKITEKEKEWSDFIEPYIRNLEAKKQYSHNVCDQLRYPQSEEININLVYTLLCHICQDKDNPGAILVFLTGLSEISSLIRLMEESRKFPPNRYVIIPLHSLLSTVDQKRIFNRPPPGVRKIVVATNIAETSITIDDVVFVIDCGKIKMCNYNVQTDTQTLLPEWVSLANANQRRGRAGRTQEGVCYHLFSKIRRITLEEYQQPEILRKRLEDTILTLKMLKLGKAEPFLQSLMDSPDPRAVEASIRLLIRLNALDNDEKLTPLGYHLAKLPMAPQMGKMILMGAIFSCLDPILSIAATLDYKDGFVTVLGKEKELDRKKLQLTNGVKNDHLVFIEALRNFEEAQNKWKFCSENFLSYNTMRLLKNMKQQFMDYLYEMNFVPNSNPRCFECNVNWTNKSLIQAVVCSGLYPNVAVMRKKKSRFKYTLKTMEDNLPVTFHPKSLLTMCDNEYVGTNTVVYHLKLKSSKTFLHDASVVNPLSLLFFGDTYIQSEDSKEYTVGVGKSINFKTNPRTAAIIKELRDRLNWFLEYKAANPGPVRWEDNGDDIKLLQAIMELITSEDKGDLSDTENDCQFIDDNKSHNMADHSEHDLNEIDDVRNDDEDEIDNDDTSIFGNILDESDFIVIDECYNDSEVDNCAVEEVRTPGDVTIEISSSSDEECKVLDVEKPKVEVQKGTDL